MGEPPAGLWVPALIRRVHAQGEFATVLHRGHESSHGVILVHQPREGEAEAFERLPGAIEGHRWRRAASGREAVDRFCECQLRFDPDLWIVELAVADPERFVAGWPAED